MLYRFQMCEEDRHLVADKAIPTRESLITSPPMAMYKGPGRKKPKNRATSHQNVLMTNLTKSGHPVGNGLKPMLPIELSKGAKRITKEAGQDITKLSQGKNGKNTRGVLHAVRRGGEQYEKDNGVPQDTIDEHHKRSAKGVSDSCGMRTILAVAFTHVGFRYGSPCHSDVTVAWQVVMAMFPEQVALFALAFLGLPCLPDGVTFSIQAPSAGHEHVAQLNQVHAAYMLAGHLLTRWPELGKAHWICAAPTSMLYEHRVWLGTTLAPTVAKALVDAANIATIVATNTSISPASRSMLLQQIMLGVRRIEERQLSQSPPLPAPGPDQLEFVPPGDNLLGVPVPRLRSTPARSPPGSTTTSNGPPAATTAAAATSAISSDVSAPPAVGTSALHVGSTATNQPRLSRQSAHDEHDETGVDASRHLPTGFDLKSKKLDNGEYQFKAPRFGLHDYTLANHTSASEALLKWMQPGIARPPWSVLEGKFNHSHRSGCSPKVAAQFGKGNRYYQKLLPHVVQRAFDKTGAVITLEQAAASIDADIAAGKFAGKTTRGQLFDVKDWAGFCTVFIGSSATKGWLVEYTRSTTKRRSKKRPASPTANPHGSPAPTVAPALRIGQQFEAAAEQSHPTGAASVATEQPSEDANPALDFSFSNFMNSINALCTSNAGLPSFIQDQEGPVPMTE